MNNMKTEVAIVNFLFRMSSAFSNLDELENSSFMNVKHKKDLFKNMDFLNKFTSDVSKAIYEANPNLYSKFLDAVDELDNKVLDDNEDIKQLKLLLIKMFDALEILKAVKKKAQGKEVHFMNTCIMVTERILNRKYLKIATVKFDYLEIKSKFIPLI